MADNDLPTMGGVKEEGDTLQERRDRAIERQVTGEPRSDNNNGNGNNDGSSPRNHEEQSESMLEKAVDYFMGTSTGSGSRSRSNPSNPERHRR